MKIYLAEETKDQLQPEREFDCALVRVVMVVIVRSCLMAISGQWSHASMPSFGLGMGGAGSLI
jgi:hypothetical protein